MTPHEQIYAAIGDLANGRVFAGIADEGVSTPYITYQVIGGPPIKFVTGEKPSKSFSRVQINVWAGTSIEAFRVAAAVEDALRAASHLQTDVLTNAGDDYDEVTKDHGAMQEFMIFC